MYREVSIKAGHRWSTTIYKTSAVCLACLWVLPEASFLGTADCNTISSRLWINILKHLETWWEHSTLTVYITKYPTIAIHCCYLNYIVMQGVCSKIALKMDKNSSQRAISELLGGIVIKCGPICYNHILAEVLRFIIKVFFNRCLLCEVRIVFSSVLWCNSCNSVFFFFSLVCRIFTL